MSRSIYLSRMFFYQQFDYAYSFQQQIANYDYPKQSMQDLQDFNKQFRQLIQQTSTQFLASKSLARLAIIATTNFIANSQNKNSYYQDQKTKDK